MKGSPQTAAEWADALEDEAIAEAMKQDGTVDDIRTVHADMIKDLFQRRADANGHSSAIVHSFMQDMQKALRRVADIADAREGAVTPDQSDDATLPATEILIEDVDAKDLASGKFKDAPTQLAA